MSNVIIEQKADYDHSSGLFTYQAKIRLRDRQLTLDNLKLSNSQTQKEFIASIVHKQDVYLVKGVFRPGPGSIRLKLSRDIFSQIGERDVLIRITIPIGVQDFPHDEIQYLYARDSPAIPPIGATPFPATAPITLNARAGICRG